jgi:hypothetical protein
MLSLLAAALPVLAQVAAGYSVVLIALMVGVFAIKFIASIAW